MSNFHIDAATKLLESQSSRLTNHLTESDTGEPIDSTCFMMEWTLSEEEAHVGEHVGFRYRSAHPDGHIARLEKDENGKVKRVWIKPDAKDKHAGERAEVPRKVGKFHAISEGFVDALNNLLLEYNESMDAELPETLALAIRELGGRIDEVKATPAGKEVRGAVSDEGALKYVKKVGDKWALVSRKTGRPLKYFDKQPSEEAANKALGAIKFFQHH